MVMISFSAAVAVLALVSAQEPTVDPTLVASIFGTPSTLEGTASQGTSQGTPATPTKKGLEDIKVKPTDRPTVITDASGNSCQCVPYYLCDGNRIAVDANNVSVTGWGELDIRFGEDDGPPPPCQESVEVCCQAPRPAPADPTPGPLPPAPRGCGYRNPRGLGASVLSNGMEAQFGEFPWVVALVDSANGSYVGVGVLIHPQVVLTGAHVVYRYASGELTARAGEWDTQTLKEIYPFQERQVQDVYYHDGFLNKSLKNDVALLRLARPLELAGHVAPLCLPAQGTPFDGARDCVANGWGKDTFGLRGRYAVILKKVELDVVGHARCEQLLRRTRLGARFRLHDSFLCAGGVEGRDICQGDGGGPLACPTVDGRYTLAGLVAWGIGCGQRDVPGVFARVAAFRDWVDSRMEVWGYGTSTYTM